ncbi:hypothetical protein AAFF_G00296350 [Aldrovandia affinis]|uniref:Uncharacterized protein n=1 Tax=Aldrovandia affinis TaxID=143900 RepID=A0AAD7SPV4_9TELE|nr:hypothetical protein AAFF_G00296350 [Aldrovandia affinis]
MQAWRDGTALCPLSPSLYYCSRNPGSSSQPCRPGDESPGLATVALHLPGPRSQSPGTERPVSGTVSTMRTSASRPLTPDLRVRLHRITPGTRMSRLSCLMAGDVPREGGRVLTLTGHLSLTSHWWL